ncbi:ABC transporter substrate-binding protein [Sphingomonas profundi]|uniref:ABC transporter substrate-binding protein n=1 Tax=Alterirhizorhabdus profundi TaxID=2681549 RepID=UPI0012E8E611|nr:ABC transporter substrate-binding protein [Sphingomonas profundi]
MAVVSALAGSALAGAPLPPAHRAAAPKRIVSLNLCADQYLLALADRSQIAGLTRNATSTEMSAAAAQARGLPILRGSAEEVLAIDPDLIVGVPARRSGMMAALSREHYAMVDLKPASTYADIVAQIRAVAGAIGHPRRGEALIARMDRALATLPRPHRAGVAAYYQRRGYLTGTGTLIDELMVRVGLANLAGKLDKPALSQLTLEELMVAQPDYLIVESASDRVVDQGTEMLHHPLLRNIRRLHIPQAWTVCGGPAYVDAARSLARQIADAGACAPAPGGRVNIRCPAAP